MSRLTQPRDPTPRKPKLACPPGAWDCHFHLFGPETRFPFPAGAHYTSADATAEMLFEAQAVLGLARGVVVSGGAYGRTYAVLEDALKRFPQRLRGVILPPENLDAAEIGRLHALGVRGIRFISEQRPGKLPALSVPLARRVHEIAGWQVHFYPGDDLAEYAPRLMALPNTIVLDHFASVRAERGADQPAMKTLRSLLDSGRVWCKISGPMRCVEGDYPYAAVTPIARALVAHSPERLIWGSDWPHVNMNGRGMPNDGDLFDLLGEWVPDAATRRRILVENPETLFR